MKFIAFFCIFSHALFALPQNGVFVHGEGKISTSGNQMTIQTTSKKTIIEWDAFTVKSDEVVKVVQPNDDSTCLCRAKGNSFSSSEGNLLSNGSIYLIAQEGVMIGSSARVEVDGFLFSSLDVKNSEFLDGSTMHFYNAGVNIGVTNFGSILCQRDLTLLGGSIDALGSMKTQGILSIGAGNEIVYSTTDENRIYVINQREYVGNRGVSIDKKAEAAQIFIKSDGNLHSLGIRLKGELVATGTVKADGKLLIYSPDGIVDISRDCILKAVTKSNMDANIHIQAEDIRLHSKKFDSENSTATYLNLTGSVFVYP